MLKKAKLSPTCISITCSPCLHNPTSKTSPSAASHLHTRSMVKNSDCHITCQKRSYARAAPSEGYEFRDNMHWPSQKTEKSSLTPYEILNLKRGAVYSKHRFYELVKIYHPDMNGSGRFPGENLTHAERLERYRLVVLAHEILSDPVKRRAYDSYGAGWGEGRATSSRYSRGYTSNSGKTYGYGPDHDNSPFGNATWEDWERWYRRADASQKQAYAGTYVNPNAFASFVILLAVLTGIAQATRAGQYAGTFEERAQAFTEETSRFLASRADHFAEHKMTSDGRIRHFLEKRDPSRYGLKDEEEATYRKHFAGEQPMPPQVTTRKYSNDDNVVAD